MSPGRGKALEETYEKLLAISLNQAPLDGIEDLVVPDVMGFGTTLDEKIHDLEGYINLIRGQEEEAKNAGLDFRFEPERIHQRISPANDADLFVEQIIATLKSEGEIVQQFNFRFSALMELIDDRWKLVHWHGSVPTDTENDTWHINKFEKEKIRLEKLVAEQTTDLQQKNRELEVEVATERIRARAMAMEKPDDMKDKILQPFFSTKKGTQGTGLGLSITNDIIKAHGCKMNFESVEGEKTRFIITIPI